MTRSSGLDVPKLVGATHEREELPHMHRRKLPQLGSPTLQRAEIESEQLRATNDVHAAALEYRKRPREPAIADGRCTGVGVSGTQPWHQLTLRLSGLAARCLQHLARHGK